MRNLAITSIKKIFDQQHALDINFSYTPFSILRIALSKRIVKKKKKKERKFHLIFLIEVSSYFEKKKKKKYAND